MKLIVGLGNPGNEYENTRHNVGFMVVKELARVNRLKFKVARQFNAITTVGMIGTRKCCLAMPETFMNLSGYSVRLLADWLKIDFMDMLVIIDDVALDFGRIRIRAKGSDAGHRGLRSITEYLQTSEFPRMKIGIRGRSQIKGLSRYVLSRFTAGERKILPSILRCAYQACECWIEEGVNAAMNRYNSWRAVEE